MGKDKICPICKKQNNCRVDGECWCKDYEIPKAIFYLVEDHSSCICKNCIDELLRKGTDYNMLETIFTRRSIRKFTGEVLDDKDLKLILKAGFQAPSAHNKEPREFLVVKDKEKLEKITEFHTYAQMLPNAGCGIIVCGDSRKQERLGHLVADCSASMENMLLAAHSLGLGAVWTGIHPIEKLEDDFRELFNIPKDLLPVGMVVVGPSDVEAKTIDRYDEGKIHYDKW